MFRVLFGAVAHRKAKVPEDTALLHEVEGDMSIVPGQVKLERWACGGVSVVVRERYGRTER